MRVCSVVPTAHFIMTPRSLLSRLAGASLALALLSSVTSLSAAVELHVNPRTGSDLAAGTAEAPLATPAMALRQARELRRLKPDSLSGGLSILFAPGSYFMEEPLYLRSDDTGTEEAPLILRAEQAGTAVFSGGMRLTNWKPAAEHPRLSEAARAKVIVTECLGADGNPQLARQLWVKGQRLQRARFPDAPQMARLKLFDVEGRRMGMEAAGLPVPSDLRGVEMFVLQQWEIAHLRLRSLEREGDLAVMRFLNPESRIEFEHPWPQPIMPPEGAGVFLLVGAPEFISQPGEWAQEPGTGRILLWPPVGSDVNDLTAVVPVQETLLEIRGTLDRPVSQVRVEGLAFEYAAWLRPSQQGHVPLQAAMYLVDAYKLRPKGTPDWRSLDNQAWLRRPAAAVVLEGVSNVRLDSCSIRHTAISGLDVIGSASGVRIENCEFTDIGGNGIQAGSFQDGPAETHLPFLPSDPRVLVSKLTITESLFQDIANEDWGCVGIIAGYVRDSEISYNTIRDTSYTGISLGWGWTRTLNCMQNNLVKGNLIERYATRMCDTAGIYTLSAQPGTVVCENVVRDVTISPWVDRPDHWFYLYTDEGSSYMTIRDNWTTEAKFLENAIGPNNVWENNGPQVSEEIVKRAGRSKK